MFFILIILVLSFFITWLYLHICTYNFDIVVQVVANTDTNIEFYILGIQSWNKSKHAVLIIKFMRSKKE